MTERTDDFGKLVTKLIKVQSGLHAPKDKAARNTNGSVRYSYRSCEDILEAVKPLLADVGAVILLDDQIEQVGDRFYVKATATFLDENGSLAVSAYARETLTRTGLDDAQLTGACSSYARKYALNGLLAIDDTKDADEMYDESPSRAQRATKAESAGKSATSTQAGATARSSASHAMTLEEAQGIAIKSANGEVFKMGELDPDTLAKITRYKGSAYTDAQKLAAKMVLDAFAS